jgi:hypothetical protein
MENEKSGEYQIEKQQLQDSALSFDFLRARGLELVQAYAGHQWTDYNLHDPGVTILEHLCFALTDLAYRTGFSVEDILTEADGRIDPDKNLFYDKKRILTGKPVLPVDFRKLVIDNVPEVHNIWIDALEEADQVDGVKGLYKVSIQPDTQLFEKNRNQWTAEQEQAYWDAIVKKVSALLCSSRSLGEDFDSFTLLKPLPFEIEAEVVLERHQLREEVLADIYDQLIKAIIPPIHFYTEQQLLDEGKRVEEIYTGPALRHGFIKETELVDKVSVIDPSDLMQIILGVTGVKYVKRLVVRAGDELYEHKNLVVPEGFFPWFMFNHDEPAITLFTESYESPIKTNIFKGLFHKKSDLARRKFIEGIGKSNSIGVNGSYRNIGNYYSIQHLFPPLYRLNASEIENPQKRKSDDDAEALASAAKVKQLKAYLSLFEQLMANYLAQLDNIKNLFTAEINEAGFEHTYFPGHIYDVPGLGNILSGFMQPDKYLIEADWEAFMEKPDNAYLQFLKNATETRETFERRKKKVLDHLLSRFNINLLKYPQQIYGQMYGADQPENELESELQWKARILKQLVDILGNRNQAFDYTDSISKRRSGFETMMEALLYLPEQGSVKISSAYEQNLSGISMVRNNAYQSYPEGKTVVYEVYWEEERLEMLIAESRLEQLLEKNGEPFATAFDHGLTISRQGLSFLKAGIDRKNFRIGPEINGQGYLVLYRPPRKRQWSRIGVFETREKALDILNDFITNLKQVSVHSEGFHVVEHVLLRPLLTKPVFGFQVLDEKGLVLLQQDHWMTYEERSQALQQIQLLISASDQTDRADITASLEGICQVNLSQDPLFTWMVTPDTLVTAYREQADHFIRKISHTFRSLNHMEQGRYPLIQKMIMGKTAADLREDFYAFRVSVVLPAWPARFQDTSFREFTESLFAEHAPAHLRLRFLWLNPDRFRAFETVYFDWIDAIREGRDTQRCAELSEQLTTVLLAK